MDADGAVCSRTINDSQPRYTFRWEMQYLLELSGFEILELHGDLDGLPFDEDGTVMVWVAGARS